MVRKRLPIGIQTFREIREDGCYYVDKTEHLLRLISEGKYYFLSRPRRFGKSLLIDTLAELFAGKQALFHGLHCHDRWDWSVRHPVIRISFGGGVLTDRAALDERIGELLASNEERLGVATSASSSAGRFGALIRAVERHYGQRAVVLVDEYDKPILDNLRRPAVAAQMRDGLRDLYSVIKDSDAHVKFAMLTGVSKFSKVSLFSGLNNLDDITLDARYSAICGYTDADVDSVFAAELFDLDRERIRDWYNGYNWTGEAVYNPFDLLLLFQKRDFRPYWFETGTPSFLVDVLTERKVFLPRLGHMIASDVLLSAFEVGDIAVEALMFQTGYLTIESVADSFGERMYTLCYPNAEVRRSLNGALLLAWGSGDNAQIALSQRAQLGRLLQANDFAGMKQLFTAFFASIPHDWFRNNPIARYEGYYASVFYAYFAALGLDVVPEESSNAGRLDMAVRFNGEVYLFEFKVVELAMEGSALEQLRSRGYADKYLHDSAPIHLIGVEFSRDQRRVVGFEVETLER